MQTELKATNSIIFPAYNWPEGYDSNNGVGKQLSELNISNILNAVSQNKSFVAFYETEDNKSKCLAFSLKGRLVYIDRIYNSGNTVLDQIDNEIANDIYAYCAFKQTEFIDSITNKSTTQEFSYQVPNIFSSNENTVVISTEKPSDSFECLHLLSKKDGKWTIPNSSKLLINFNQIINGFDFGELD